MTRELALEGGAHGIRANSINPGIIESPATTTLLDDETVRRNHLDSIMLRRLGAVSDVASAALFLASDESSWITGAALSVDGGYTAR